MFCTHLQACSLVAIKFLFFYLADFIYNIFVELAISCVELRFLFWVGVKASFSREYATVFQAETYAILPYATKISRKAA